MVETGTPGTMQSCRPSELLQMKRQTGTRKREEALCRTKAADGDSLQQTHDLRGRVAGIQKSTSSSGHS